MSIEIITSQSTAVSSVNLNLNLGSVSSVQATNPKGDSWNWEGITKEKLGLNSAEAKGIRVPARKYCEQNLIAFSSWENIISGTSEETKAKMLDFYSKNTGKFFKLAEVLRVGIVGEGSRKGAVILIHLPKLQAEVERSIGEKVKK